MKICNKCLEAKPFSDFAKNSSKRDGLQGMCRPCKKKVDARHYRENREKQLDRNRANRQKYREQVNRVKDVPCADCGVRYPPYVMDFDHVGDDKIGDISAMCGNVSMEKVLAEIAKCEVVCSNCHRMRTWNRRQASVV